VCIYIYVYVYVYIYIHIYLFRVTSLAASVGAVGAPLREDRARARARRHPALFAAAAPAQRSMRRGGRPKGIHCLRLSMSIHLYTYMYMYIYMSRASPFNAFCCCGTCATLYAARRTTWRYTLSISIYVYTSIHIHVYVYIHVSRVAIQRFLLLRHLRNALCGEADDLKVYTV